MQIFSQLNINLAIIMIFGVPDRASSFVRTACKAKTTAEGCRTISYTRVWHVHAVVHRPSVAVVVGSTTHRKREETWRNVSCTRANKLKSSCWFSSDVLLLLLLGAVGTFINHVSPLIAPQVKRGQDDEDDDVSSVHGGYWLAESVRGARVNLWSGLWSIREPQNFE